MSVAIRVDDGGGRNVAQVAVPVWLEARFTVDRDMVKRQYEGVPVNDLSPLYPLSHVRFETLRWCRQWVHDMKGQGKDLLSNESEVLLYGPYAHRTMNRAKNDFSARGWAEGEDTDPDKADFVIKACFINRRAPVGSEPTPERKLVAA